MLNYLPIVPKASIYVPKVMRKPVIGGNTVCLRLSRTCFFSEVCEVSKSGPEEQSIWSIMAEYGREGCIEISSHCAQSLHTCPKGNAQTSHRW